MFERAQAGERGIVVHIDFPTFAAEQADLTEFQDLVTSAGVTVLQSVITQRRQPDPSTYIGKGKLEEIHALIQTQQADVVLFNHSLSPAQERNIERIVECRVIDREGVILDIFAQRARSFEGQLQVELAQLKHLSSRLIRGWSHLERQKGGIGLRGPGETQLETDRRLLAERVKHIQRRLEKVRQQRQLSRRSRQRAALPVVALVGYTNAGKSTLFNRLTSASVYAADQLFATLDATLRRLELPDKSPVIVADTVGFIQHLPHDLIAAFRATLEETRQADLLLHVVDASDPQRQEHIEQVQQVLQDIEADKVKQVLIYNKIDCLTDSMARVERDAHGQIRKIHLSAQTGAGIDLLQNHLLEILGRPTMQKWVKIPACAVGRLRARLFSLGTVLHEEYTANGDSVLKIKIAQRTLAQLTASEPQLAILDTLAGLPKAT